jgi:hypothetical protein
VAWVAVDDNFVEHEKVSAISDRAFRLHMAALCYCGRNLTDGRLSDKAVRVLKAIVDGTPRHVRELVTAGLWRESGNSYEVHDYLEHNPSAEEVKELRRKRREAGRQGGLKSGESRRGR